MNQQTATTATQPEASARKKDVYQSITDQIVASMAPAPSRCRGIAIPAPSCRLMP
jgi:hypothetical protein